MTGAISTFPLVERATERALDALLVVSETLERCERGTAGPSDLLDPLARAMGYSAAAFLVGDDAESDAALTIPLVAGRRRVAVLAFYGPESGWPAPFGSRTLEAIGRDVGRFVAGGRMPLVPTPLSARELEVIELAAAGLSGREIAATLVISSATVKTHFENLYAKLGVSDRAAAVAAAIRCGWID